MATAPNPSFTRFSVAPLTTHIGAEISGIDLRDEQPDEVIAEIRKALLTYKVIFFRDQDVTQEQQIGFGRRFGDLEIHPLTDEDQPNPEILHLKSGTRVATAAVWHSDVTWRETPPLGSILRARIMPEVGGDTIWSDQVAAYEGLSPAMKEWVCTLTALHDGSQFKDRTGGTADSFWEKYPVQEHPVVRTHPETGERALYVNTSFTVGIKDLSKKESDWLLQHLYDQALKAEYQVRFRWEVNSVAFWDNRACQHYAVHDYAPAIRHMERVTIVGDKPFLDPSR
ncbi:MAG: TauD/TfdA family dioxygenase [Sphingomonadaceae bacterium]|nr:TauD/TfdA family dioxygenase [Sphingomonadaceae bacterium]